MLGLLATNAIGISKHDIKRLSSLETALDALLFERRSYAQDCGNDILPQTFADTPPFFEAADQEWIADRETFMFGEFHLFHLPVTITLQYTRT